jgi:predicted enzyme related to lactoylglutathione lyase
MTNDIRFNKSRVTLGVKDVAKSLRFYREALGFEVLHTMGEPASFAILQAGSTGMALVKSERPAVAEFACVYFELDGVESLLSRCQSANAKIATPLTRQPWGNYDFVVEDPDGHKIALGEVPAR